MKNIVLFFPALTLIWIQYARALQEDTMDTYKPSITLYEPSFGALSSGILKSHNGVRYTVGRNKTLFVSAPNGYRILVSIRMIDLRPYQQDLLTLFNVNGPRNAVTYSNPGRNRKRNYYPNEDLIFEVPNGQLGITFYTSPALTNFDYDGFKLVYTVQSSFMQCTSRDYHCNNLRCIAQVLRCDGHNHCGDRSSELNCSNVMPDARYSGRKIGIGVGIVFLIIAIACGIYIFVRRARRTETQTVIHSHPPPQTNLPSYPPPGTYYPPPPPPYSQGVTNPGYH